MSSPLPVRPVALLAAIGVGAVEWWLSTQAGLIMAAGLPLAFATGGSVIWAALALDALGRRQKRPDRGDIAQVTALQTTNRNLLKQHHQRLSDMQQSLALLSARAMLDDVDRDLAEAARIIDRWDGIALALPQWLYARARWRKIVERLDPSIVMNFDSLDEDELRNARERLPVAHNFSSQDLKAAATYIVLSERLTAARLRWSEFQQAQSISSFETLAAKVSGETA